MAPVERVERCRTLLLWLHCLTHTISSIEVCVRHWKNFDIRSSMLDCGSTSSSGFISLRKESNRPEGVLSSWAGISSIIVGGGVSSSCSKTVEMSSTSLVPLLSVRQHQFSEEPCPALASFVAFLSHRPNQGVILSLHHKEVSTNQNDGHQCTPNDTR